jgi:hypothetical protein
MSKSQIYNSAKINNLNLAALATKRYFANALGDVNVRCTEVPHHLKSYSGREMSNLAHVSVDGKDLRRIALVNDFGILVGDEGGVIHADSELKFDRTRFEDCYNLETAKAEAELQGYSVRDYVDENGVLSLEIDTY